jgi:hypothetical protein
MGGGPRANKYLAKLRGKLQGLLDRHQEKEGVTVDNRITEIADRLLSATDDTIVSLFYYPHLIPKVKIPYPYTVGGFVVVFKDEVESVVDLILETYRHIPPTISVHCVRRSELPELSLPTFTWLDMVNKHLHMAFWLKHRGVVLYGPDVRGEIGVPPDARTVLGLHVEVCRHFSRNNMILGWLMSKNYVELIRKLDWQIRCLMASALLEFDLPDLTTDTIPEAFERLYQDSEAKDVWGQFSALANSIESASAADESTLRRTAFDAVWLFERFLRRLDLCARHP